MSGFARTSSISSIILLCVPLLLLVFPPLMVIVVISALWQLDTSSSSWSLLLFLSIFTTVSGDPARSHGDHVVYTRDQLVALLDPAVLLPEVRPDVPRELRRRKRGCRAGVKRRAGNRLFKPVLPSVVTGNVRSLVNQTDELKAVTRHQREYRECSLMVFTETWLTEFTPDTLHSTGSASYGRTAERGR